MTLRSGAPDRAPLPIVIVGHVDHGKSTLIGRLLNDTGSLPEGKVEALNEMCRRRGMPFEWSFVTDALQAERDQGITIDASQVRFHSAARAYLLVDAPGHKEFLKNMVTGAASADAAVLVVDVAEGLSEQTRRHAHLLALLGIRQIAVAVNKMDAVGFARPAYTAVRDTVAAYLARLGLAAAAIVPVSARDGDGIIASSPRAPWYDGPSLIEALDGFPDPAALADGPLRLPVQDVYKFDERRIVVGRIESGRLRLGDVLRFEPGGRQARIASIESWNAAPALSATAGQSVGITLDEDVFVERGHTASHVDAAPPAARRLKLRAFSFASEPLGVGDRCVLRVATAEYPVTVEAILGVVQLDAPLAAADSVGRYDLADLVVAGPHPIVVDDARQGLPLRRAVLTRGREIVAACVVDQLLPSQDENAANDRNLFAMRSAVSRAERERIFGHAGGVVWLTGLSGAGKSTLARALERHLFDLGYRAALLDGDALRQGLNADLGFSPSDRSENVRRVGEVARLFAENGSIAIVACISPRVADRERVHALCGDAFHEVYVKASVKTCIARDPKGLYRRAVRGEIGAFTGVSAPYEAPSSAAHEIDTDQLAIDEPVRRLSAFVEARFGRQRTTKAAS
jgi:bifunctional enzyme CysN/CysC